MVFTDVSSFAEQASQEPTMHAGSAKTAAAPQTHT
jgi:hypothetical protein